MAAGDVFEDITDVSAGSTATVSIAAGTQVIVSAFGGEDGSITPQVTDGTLTAIIGNAANADYAGYTARPTFDGDANVEPQYNNNDSCNARAGYLSGREI